MEMEQVIEQLESNRTLGASVEHFIGETSFKAWRQTIRKPLWIKGLAQLRLRCKYAAIPSGKLLS